MRKNHYYQTIVLPQAQLENGALNAAIYFCKIPQLLLQVFIRKNFGERYFGIGFGIQMTVILAVFPIAIIALLRRLGVHEASFTGYIGWYVFTALFLVMSIWHERRITRSRSSFDFSLYSRYEGKIHPFFYKLKWRSKEPSVRRIECFLEPAGFFLLGFLLLFLGQYVGLLLMACSVLYRFGYRCAYIQGDHYVLNLIDEAIANEEMEKNFLDDLHGDDTKGFCPRIGKPEDEELRRKLLSSIMGKPEASEVI